MRKIFAILLLFGCYLSSPAQQKDFKTEFYVGVKGGMTFTKVRFYPNVESSFLQGKTGGLIFRLISEPHIGFQVELNYIQKGWQEIPFIGEFASTTYFHRLNYIDLPIMTHVNLGKKAVRFIFNLGPEFSFLKSEDQGFKPNNTIPSDTEGYKAYYGNNIDTNFDILGTVGIGFEYHLKGGSAISLEGRGYYSLPNLFDTENYPYKASQSNGFQVTMAYLFQLNRAHK